MSHLTIVSRRKLGYYFCEVIKLTDEDERQKKRPVRKAFVITPIGSDNSTVRRMADGLIDSVISPVLSNKGFEIVASHRVSETGMINRQVLNHILDDDLAIANLTGLNANVMYELAVRHATGKPVIVMCVDGQTLPFDIQDARTIFYQDDMQGVIEARDNLQKFIDKINYNETSENPVTAAAGRPIKVEGKDISAAESTLRGIDSINRELNVVKRKIDDLSRGSNLNVMPGLNGGASIDSLFTDTNKIRHDIGAHGLSVPFGSIKPYAPEDSSDESKSNK